jgi:hypothetical protein
VLRILDRATSGDDQSGRTWTAAEGPAPRIEGPKTPCGRSSLFYADARRSERETPRRVIDRSTSGFACRRRSRRCSRFPGLSTPLKFDVNGGGASTGHFCGPRPSLAYYSVRDGISRKACKSPFGSTPWAAISPPSLTVSATVNCTPEGARSVYSGRPSSRLPKGRRVH